LQAAEQVLLVLLPSLKPSHFSCAAEHVLPVPPEQVLEPGPKLHWLTPSHFVPDHPELSTMHCAHVIVSPSVVATQLDWHDAVSCVPHGPLGGTQAAWHLSAYVPLPVVVVVPALQAAASSSPSVVSA
jgi:hypothetical protein